jgi:hypothetical protein
MIIILHGSKLKTHFTTYLHFKKELSFLINFANACQQKRPA